MGTFWESMAGAFIGKILAAIFIAVCFALGFGPDEWAAAVMGADQEQWIWGVRVVFVLLAIAVFWKVFFTGAGWPFSRHIPLHKAVCLAYEKTKQTAGIQAMENFPSFDRSRLLGFMAQKLVNDSVNVFGRCPPSNKQGRLPADHAAVYQFNNDATEMCDIDNDANHYVNLKIKRSDLNRRIKELLATNGS